MSTADPYRDQMRQAYENGTVPWDIGVPNAELIRALEAGFLPGKTALEFGCGTGTNAIDMARRGYQVTAVDLIELPIHRAREKAKQAQVAVDFHVGDLTQIDLGGPYDVLFDSGLYHGIRMRNLPGFLRTLERVSRPGTRWLSIAGSAKEPLAEGPPVVAEEAFRAELGPLFKFLTVREFRPTLRGDLRPLMWSILMERR